MAGQRPSGQDAPGRPGGSSSVLGPLLDPLLSAPQPGDDWEAEARQAQLYAAALLPPLLAAPLPGHSAVALHESFLTTGCSSLDAFLGGSGVLASNGHVLEIAGEAGAGKTQWSLQLALMAAMPASRAGLDAGAIYINTESDFPWRRMAQIAAALLGSQDQVPLLMDRIIVEDCKSADRAMDLITKPLHSSSSTRLQWLVEKSNARLIIMDSIAAIFRPELGDDAMKRAPLLWKLASALKELGAEGIAIVIVNQVTDRINPNATPTSRTSALTDKVPALGMVWSMCVNTRIMLSRRMGLGKQPSTRKATVTMSSYLQEGTSIQYIITASGVEGMPNDGDFDDNDDV